MALASADVVFVTATDKSYYLQALECEEAESLNEDSPFEQIAMMAGSRVHAREFLSSLCYKQNFQGEDYGVAIASLVAAGIDRDEKTTIGRHLSTMQTNCFLSVPHP